MDLELTGRAAVVTGGSRGIGKAIARALAAEGCNVGLVARDATTLEAAAREIAAATNRKVAGLAADTGSDDDVRRVAEAARAALGPIDILVNCAAQPGGQARPPALGEITDDHFFADMNVKVMGYLRTARAFAPEMKARRFGRIINVSGLAARSTGTIIGSMRNVSVAAMTKNIAEELAGTGVTATCVHPGLTRTEKTPGVVAARAKAKGVSEAEIEAEMGATNLTHRIITAEEIAHVVVFLASPRSVAINGDAIAAGGGARGSIHY
jgi:NAD(P)-dependent dehydrogenase (short-subunit alcohol dehydrogenase family)